jgi:hypothetical protein
MALGKFETLNLLAPLLNPSPAWFLDGLEDYRGTVNVDRRLRQGARTRALWVQREAVHRAHADPAVVGAFVPVMLDQRECIMLQGEDGSPNVCVLLNKATRVNGKLWTARQRTQRHKQRRDGSVTLYGIDTIPVIIYWTLRRTADSLANPVVETVGIGEEGQAGFIWEHTIWKEGEGFTTAIVDPQPPLLPMPEVRLRRPAAAEAPARVGVRVEERQRVAEGEKSRRDKKDSGGVA